MSLQQQRQAEIQQLRAKAEGYTPSFFARIIGLIIFSLPFVIGFLFWQYPEHTITGYIKDYSIKLWGWISLCWNWGPMEIDLIFHPVDSMWAFLRILIFVLVIVFLFLMLLRFWYFGAELLFGTSPNSEAARELMKVQQMSDSEYKRRIQFKWIKFWYRMGKNLFN